MTDTSIVQRAMSGDPKAAEQLFRETYSETYNLAFRLLRNKQDAEDLVQEAYVSAFQNLEHIHDPSKFDAWIKRIVSNLCKDFFKKKTPTLFTELELPEDDEPFEIEDTSSNFSPEVVADRAEYARIVQMLANQLPEEQRICILMVDGAEMTAADAAGALGIPEGTVKSRVRYGRKKLEELVLDYEKKNNIRLHSLGPIAILGLLRWMQSSSVVQPTADAVSAVVQGATHAATALSSAGSTATAVATAGKAGAAAKGLGVVGKIVAGIVSAGVVATGVIMATSTEAQPPVDTSDSIQIVQTLESTMTDDVIDSDEQDIAHIHAFVVTVVPPSCAKKGYTLRKCSCGESHKESYTEMVDHSFGSWIELKRPSPYHDGEKGKFCVVCGEKISEILYYKPCVERGIDVFEVQAQAQAYIETLENAVLDPTRENGHHAGQISTVPCDTQEELLEYVKERILYLYSQGMESHSSITMNVFVEEHPDCPGEYGLLPLYWIE